ncbi:MAG TPA: sugar phosphate isomerase/epimerase [Tepidisphaeraceae bacterium]|jgi:sugar phosphate isomerase/epimerase|nr:sugar phosphate isomerase/epimerase [Tepidisphaeraceae bacterium]
MASTIAAQLYTLRDFTKTPGEIASTLARVKKIGYDAVQLSALGKVDAKELAGMLQGEGLACCATHISLDRMRDESAKVIDEHHLWDCKYTAVGGFFPKNPVAGDWPEFARGYNAIAGKYRGSGVAIGYHNHSHELARFDGKTGLQILLDHFSPDIWWEIDTYWIQHGGGDPMQWIGKVAGKIPCVHLKDMAITADRTQLMAEVGEGNLNWPAILKACRDARVQWYIIEQDICQRDPFESLAISLKNARELGLE